MADGLSLTWNEVGDVPEGFIAPDESDLPIWDGPAEKYKKIHPSPQLDDGDTKRHQYTDMGRLLSLLPPEILCVIFSMLDTRSFFSVQMVCKKWRDTCWGALDGIVLDQFCGMDSFGGLLQTLAKRCPRLLYLSIHGGMVETEEFHVLSKFPFLRKLNINHAMFLKDENIENLSSRLLRLELSSCEEITTTGVKKGVSRLMDLQVLKLSDMGVAFNSNFVQVDFLSRLPHLHTLDLSWNPGVKTQTVDTIVKLSSLRTLLLDGCIEMRRREYQKLGECTNLTFLSLCHIHRYHTGLHVIFTPYLSKLTNLTTLRIANCDPIGDEVLEPLCKMTNLTELDLANVPNLDDTGIAHIKPLTNLTKLDISANPRITDKSFVEVIKNLVEMKNLNISSCEVSGAGLKAIAHLSKIEALDCYKCNVRDEDLVWVDGMKSLYLINLLKTLVQREGVESLRNRPNLRVLW